MITTLRDSAALSGFDLLTFATAEVAPIDLGEQTRRVLRQPIASAPLAELAKGCRSVAIITSDATRPVPNHVLLPLVLGELREGGIDDADISIVVGTGVHRSLTPTELRDLVGDGIYARVKVVNHDARARDLVSVGTTPAGNEVRINRLVAQADLRVALGVVEPHEFAGFSGAGKAILPGVSGYDTIIRNHALHMLRHARARAGMLQGNPIHEDIAVAAELAGLHFVVNVTVDAELRATAVAAGEPRAVHGELVAFLRERVGVVAPPEPVDLLITGPGHPLDINLYQTIKALVATEGLVDAHTVTLLLASCHDGTGSQEMLEPFVGARMPEEVIGRLQTEYTIEKDHSYFIARFRSRSGPVICCCPGVSAEVLRTLGFGCAATPEEGLRLACDMVRCERDRPVAALVPRPQRLLWAPRVSSPPNPHEEGQ